MAGYDAFISYSHEADGKLSPSLQSGLQRLARPWRKRRALEVFRDRTGLAVTPHLWSEISVALTHARWLVLLASPDSAQSKWVNQEIEFFLARDPTARDRILPVVTDGVWNWAGDGAFTADSTSVPRALHGVFEEEPLYLDLRWAKDRADLSLHDPVFRGAVADVAAPIHGKTKDELVGEDVRQFRLARRARRAAVISLAALTVGALLASVIAVTKSREAVRQKTEAVAQKKVAEEQTALAEDRKIFAEGETTKAEAATADAKQKGALARSRELASAALGLKADDPAAAALLAVESLYPNDVTEMMRSPQSTNAVGVTSRALRSRLFVSAGSLPDAKGQAIVTTSGVYVATVGPSAASPCWPDYVDGVGVASPITWWNRDTGERLPGVPPGVELPVSFINSDWGVLRIDDALTVTPVVGEGCSGFVDGSVAVTGTGDIGPSVGAGAGSQTYSLPATYDPDSKLMVAFDQQAGQFVTLDPTTLVPVARMDPLDDPQLSWQDVVVANGAVTASTSDGSLRVWALTGGGIGVKFALAKPASTLASTGRMMFGGEGVAVLEGNLTSMSLPGVFDNASFALFSENERFLALIDGSCGCRAGVWDVSLNPPAQVSYISSTFVSSMQWLGNVLGLTSARGVEFYEFREPRIARDSRALSADGSTLVVWPGSSGPLEVHDASDPGGEPIRSIEVPADEFPTVEMSADGGLVSLATSAGLRVVDVHTGAEVFAREGDYPQAKFDPSGRFMAYTYDASTGTGESALEIYDTEGWTPVAAGRLPAGAAYGLQWTSASELVSQASGVLQVITVGDGTITVKAPVEDTRGYTWWSSPDRKLLVTPDDAGRVQILTGLESATAPSPLVTRDVGTSSVTQVAFSADSQRMVTVAGGSVTMWDMSTPTDPRRLEQLELLPLLVYAGIDSAYDVRVQFHPDGRSLFLNVSGNIVGLPDFDPAGVCAAVTEADLVRAEAILGNESACRRIPALAVAPPRPLNG